MTIKQLLQRDFQPLTPKKGLLPIEQLAIVYLLLTTVAIICLHGTLYHPMQQLTERGAILLGTAVAWGIYRAYSCRFTLFLRVLYQLSLLSYWYPDMYEFNRLLPNLDHVFASMEAAVFGCQPSIEFSKMMPSLLSSELFNMGYVAYYPMIAVVVLFYYLFRPKDFQKAAFTVMCAFFLFYIIFLCLPVAGPQFYFQAVGVDQILQGHFPALGCYFSQHMEMLPAPGHPEGFFYQRVIDAQVAGERPMAAFPSSHVGVSTVLILLSARTSKVLTALLLPFYVLLCCATVYIQAHYLLDATCGVVTGVLFTLLSWWTYGQLFQRHTPQDEAITGKM